MNCPNNSTDPKTPNVVWQPTKVTRADREKALGQRGRLLWFTGLSGSGKSTLAVEVENRINATGKPVYMLDGDNLRHGLCGDLGFSPDDRRENIRRVGEVAKLFVDAGITVLCAFISPYAADRDRLRDGMNDGDYVEIWVSTPIEECEKRDVKGLYAMAREGKIQNFTGVNAPYEEPTNAELVLDTSQMSVCEAVDQVLGYLASNP